jgi:hypothetical protein
VPQRSRGQFTQLAERIELSLNLVQSGTKRGQELLARRRRHHAAGGAREQTQLQALFQPANRLAQG